ncbi:hypothetical protein HU200_010659 [Digitaria exilis]|uniref:Disease resistance R13L4/SHOC-2-like LRR domain-containing protein n=1 Tax=Digitaria exilis TaxID=1010633 RepID=A0A835KPR6_9POAL|nr:hypothetical protein HU200_010659 [Digitaria exilis]
MTKLRRLQYLFGGELRPICVDPKNRLPRHLGKLCMACCAPKLLKNVEYMSGHPNRHDACSYWCHVVFPTLASRRLNPYGVVLPRGIRKVKSLRTLGLVNIAGGKAILQDIRRLTQLRRLAVIGVNQKNCQEFCSTLDDLCQLKSLLVEPDLGSSSYSLRGCLDGVSSPLKNLESLKLFGTMVKLPVWIIGLESLVKLRLRNTRLTEVDATMQVLGKLPNLAILPLWGNMFKLEDQRSLTFHREALFPSLMVLELNLLFRLRSVEFKDGATPKLELLCVCWRVHGRLL